jgi:hypothetical protein
MLGSNSLSSFVVFSICPFDCEADIFTDNCRDCFYSFGILGDSSKKMALSLKL